MNLHAPAPLSPQHQVHAFNCGQPVLDEWLKRRALANQGSGASRTFVVANEAMRVLGYYALAAGGVAHSHAGRALRQNMPDPIPVMVLGRLAVDTSAQSNRLGVALLQDAVRRCLMVAQHTGVRALLVHALDENARGFYEHHGFKPSPVHPLTLMLPLANVR
ncbi:MAG: GNAT family N-acetyltransferase [Betaproteobacteria bacterium]|nr:GNAT family N-acetyltransferase [Betaproteobacteria bacterium]